MFSTSVTCNCVGLNWMAENDNLFHSRFGECNYTGSCQVVIANSMEEAKCLSRNSAPLLKYPKSQIMFVARGGHSGVLLNATWITIWCAWQEWQSQPGWSCFGWSFALRGWHTHTFVPFVTHTKLYWLDLTWAASSSGRGVASGIWMLRHGYQVVWDRNETSVEWLHVR